MGIYSTYREAVLANGSTIGVYTDGECFLTNGSEGAYYDTRPCNPAAFLETLESFLASGKRLVDGDKIIRLKGDVFTAESRGQCTKFDDPTFRDNERFILQAAADQMETLEEKEAFDAIDTKPQQVESLSGSEKPNKSEWNGEGLPPAGAECEFREKRNKYSSVFKDWSQCKILAYNKAKGLSDELQIIIRDKNGDAAIIYSCNEPLFRKPETPAEREDRERLDAAYDLYCEFTRVNAPASTPKTFERWKSMLSVEAWLAVADKKADHRKQ